MHRPLWQLLLPILLVGAALQRAAVAAMLVLDGASALGAGLALEAAAIVAAAIGVFVGGHGILWVAIAFGLAYAVSAGLAVAVAGPAAVPGAIGKLLVAALGAAGLAFLAGRDPHGDDAAA